MLSESPVAVVEQAVASQLLPFVGQHGTVQQFRLSLLGIVISQLRINMILFTINIRRSDDIGYLGRSIVTERIGSQYELRIHQLDFVIEH